MESYRFKNLIGDHKKRLLLPLSGGISSLVLLHVLDTQLKKQLEKQNRTAYELVLVHVQTADSEGSVSAAWREKTLSRFSTYSFPSSVRIHEVFQVDQALEEDLTHLGIYRQEGENDEEFYSSIMASTRSVTTRTDLRELFLRRLLVSLAKQHKCDSILWGHSDSKLAAQALADVAQGRGGSVPAGISDGTSATGINFNHPMRDLFKSELELYASVLPEPLEVMPEAETGPSPSIRNTSIDNLLSTYILSQGEKYPSIMANVVRTAGKLQVQEKGSGAKVCCVCSSPTLQEDDVNGQSRSLCYGCERMKQDIRQLR